jgi:hypothetical protein
MRLSRVCLLLVALVSATTGSEAQSGLLLTTPPVRTMTIGGTTVLSSSVLGSYYFTRGDAGLSRLEVLVLWRGQPSWYATRSAGTGASALSSFGAHAVVAGDSRTDSDVEWAAVGRRDGSALCP